MNNLEKDQWLKRETRLKTISFLSKHHIIRTLVNRTENKLIDGVKEGILELEERYNNDYLIRRGENMHKESAKDNKLNLHKFEKS